MIETLLSVALGTLAVSWTVLRLIRWSLMRGGLLTKGGRVRPTKIGPPPPPRP